MIKFPEGLQIPLTIESGFYWNTKTIFVDVVIEEANNKYSIFIRDKKTLVNTFIDNLTEEQLQTYLKDLHEFFNRENKVNQRCTVCGK